MFELVCYMITSTCSLIHETKNYRLFRLIDSYSRLVDMLCANQFSSPEMEKIRKKIVQGKYKVLKGESQFSSFLNDLVLFTVLVMSNSP